MRPAPGASDVRGGERGQSEVLGTALIITLTLLGAGLVVAFGGAAIDETRQQLSSQAASNEMTLFDTRVAVATLGRSSPQTVQLREAGQGHYEVRPSAGWIRITQINATDEGNETIYNRTMGAVVYERGNMEMAYQAGGVWRGQQGGSTMVSPPELHYRRATLTLPVIRVNGSDGASGSVTAHIVPTRRNHPVYPNASATYTNSTTTYENPVHNGSVRVTVQSRYYLAWAHYFRTRTEGNVTTINHTAKTTTMRLTTRGTFGDFQMPGDGDAIRIRGLDEGHAMNNFSFTIYPDEDSADFANIDWSLEAKSGGQEFQLRLLDDGGKICKNGNIDAYITYDDAGTEEQTWKADNPFKTSGNGFTYECDGRPSLTIDLTNETAHTNFTYKSGPDPIDFTAHSVDTRGPYSAGDTETAKFLIGHYLGLFDSDVNLVVEDKGKGATNSASGSVAESKSFGTLLYETKKRIVTYLRVTDNEVTVSFE